MNPLLPENYCIPDVEARTWKDGSLYLYGSHDVYDTEYCSRDYVFFRTNDFVEWEAETDAFKGDGNTARIVINGNGDGKLTLMTGKEVINTVIFEGGKASCQLVLPNCEWELVLSSENDSDITINDICIE